MWCCYFIFSRISGISRSQFLLNEFAQNFIHNIFTIRKNIDLNCVYIVYFGVLLSCFFPIFCGSQISIWNCTKINDLWKDIVLICLYIFLEDTATLFPFFFFLNFWHAHTSSSIRNSVKFNAQSINHKKVSRLNFIAS